MNKFLSIALLFIFSLLSTTLYCQQPATLPDTIFFRTNKTVIDNTEFKKLDNIADYMEKYPNVKIEVIGYSPKSQNNKLATRLSLARARNVSRTLCQKYDIEETRIETFDGEQVLPENSNNKRCVIFRIRN